MSESNNICMPEDCIEMEYDACEADGAGHARMTGKDQAVIQCSVIGLIGIGAGCVYLVHRHNQKKNDYVNNLHESHRWNYMPKTRSSAERNADQIVNTILEKNPNRNDTEVIKDLYMANWENHQNQINGGNRAPTGYRLRYLTDARLPPEYLPESSLKEVDCPVGGLSVPGEFGSGQDDTVLLSPPLAYLDPLLGDLLAVSADSAT